MTWGKENMPNLRSWKWVSRDRDDVIDIWECMEKPENVDGCMMVDGCADFVTVPYKAWLDITGITIDRLTCHRIEMNFQEISVNGKRVAP